MTESSEIFSAIVRRPLYGVQGEIYVQCYVRRVGNDWRDLSGALETPIAEPEPTMVSR